MSNAWIPTTESDTTEGWCDGGGEFIGDTYTITPGYAYWLKNVPDSNSLNIAGQVKQAEKVQVTCPNKFEASCISVGA